MNSKVIMLAISSILIGSCSQDSDYFEETETIQGQIMESSSRTYLDNGQVFWKASDAISIFLKKGFHQQWELSSGENTTTATFNFKKSIGNCQELDCHYAIYPFSGEYTLNADQTIEVDLTSWAEQNYTEDSFEDDKSFMTGKTENLNIPFYNAHSLAKVNLSTDVPGSYSITSVSFTSSSTALNGKAVIDMTKDKPIVSLAETDEASNKTNTLKCTSGIILEVEPKAFYILMPTGTFNKLTLNVEGVNELDGTPMSWSKTYDEEITFKRSLIETFELVFEADDFSGSINPD